MIQGYLLDYHYHSDSFNVTFIIFFLNMVDYPVLPLLLPPKMTWDTFLMLRSTWGYYLNHVHQSLSLKII